MADPIPAAEMLRVGGTGVPGACRRCTCHAAGRPGVLASATVLHAAEVLSNRFLAGTFLQAWGRMDDPETDYAGLAIVDGMMNLPLLCWAWKETGEATYRDVAVHHADTTLKHFVRPDGSVYHALRFDTESGAPVGPDNYCGRAVESHWARGAAWAIYGFALSYRYTGDVRYLGASVRVARKFLEAMGDDAVPVWDFRLPPGEEPLVDSSAAAIAVCGFQELLHLRPGEGQLAEAAGRMPAALCTERFLDPRDTCPGVLKSGQAGNGRGSAAHAYTSWGDYFLMEALYRKLRQGPTFW